MQNFSANVFDIMVFVPCFSSPATVWGVISNMVPDLIFMRLGSRPRMTWGLYSISPSFNLVIAATAWVLGCVFSACVMAVILRLTNRDRRIGIHDQADFSSALRQAQLNSEPGFIRVLYLD